MAAGGLAYKAGDIIVNWKKPFLKVLDHRQIGKRCTNCFKSAGEGSSGSGGSIKLEACHACQISYYCSAECRKEDWEFAHSAECQMPFFRYQKLLALQKIVHPMDILVVARTCAHLQLHPERKTVPHELIDGSQRSFSQLEYHITDEEQARVVRLTKTMSAWMGHSWNPESIRKMLAIWSSNAIRFQDDVKDKEGNVDLEAPEIGGAVHVEVSGFKHSCRPNACINFNADSCAEVRCIADIVEGDQPLISHLPSEIMNREARQRELKKTLDIDCRCELCEEEKDKGGPATNYFSLALLKDSIGFAVKWGQISRVLQLREELMALYKPVLHPYDYRLTHFTKNLFTAVARHYYAERKEGEAGPGPMIPIEVENVEGVQKLADEALKGLEIGYGKEDNWYWEARANMIRLNLKVPNTDTDDDDDESAEQVELKFGELNLNNNSDPSNPDAPADT